MIRLALLDHHPPVLAGLHRLLERARGMQVLAAAADEVALARALDGRRPDILIVEHDPARGDALALCRRVKSRPGTPRVLIYSADADPALTIAARAVQADGLVDKSQPAHTLLAAIHEIAAGGTVMPRVSREPFAD
jgi:DNA-binding NarL/FixJ family response regulator